MKYIFYSEYTVTCLGSWPIITGSGFDALIYCFDESQSAVISLLSVCTIYILHVIKCIQHIQGLLSVQAQYNRSCPIISSSCYNSSLVTWTVVCLTAAKFKPLILFSVTTDGESYILSARIIHRKHSSSIVACVSVGIPTWSLPRQSIGVLAAA
jgi:hypothetical protein